MLQSIGLNLNQQIQGANQSNKAQYPIKKEMQTRLAPELNISSSQVYALNSPNTILSQSDLAKYSYLINSLKNIAPSPNSEGLSPTKQLEILLKNGKLLSKSSSDKSTTLDNLYDIATIQRADGLNSTRIITDTLDLIMNPRFITQNFGDIPQKEKAKILSQQKIDSEVITNPSLMDVTASGTCAAASNEVNLADKYPADFARWVSKLSSKDKTLYLNINLSALSKDKLEALDILKALGAKNENFSFDNNKIKVTLDDNAYVRAKIQTQYWDKGERNVADVIIQSAIMGLGSQNTYDSLIDTRAPIFNENTQGLMEVEKTFVESLIKNKEITSLIYQQIDDNQNLVGYTCSFDKMQKHLTDTLDSGEDVIIGYVMTNKTSGRTQSINYKRNIEGGPDKVINGHEITIVDYIKDDSGKINFVCIDTDDDTNNFAIYSSDWLLPKIHHAGYPAKIVEKDEKEIMAKLNI